MSMEPFVSPSGPGKTHPGEHNIRVGLLCAMILHTAFLVSLARSSSHRAIGDPAGRPDAITVEIVDAGELASPAAGAPQPAAAVPPALKPSLQAAATQDDPPPQPAALPAPDLTDTPGLFSLPSPPATSPAGGQAKDGQGKKTPAAKAQPKPPTKTTSLDLSPPSSALEAAASAGRSASSARPADITRSPQNDEFGRAVLRALRVTMPPPNDSRTRVTIRMVLSENGDLVQVGVTKPGTDTELNRSVPLAAKQASFPIPPNGSTVSDRTFLITYIYE